MNPESDTVALAYVHDVDVAYSFCHSLANLLVFDAALHGLGETTHDGKAEAGAAETARGRAVGLHEGLEQAALLLVVEADPDDLVSRRKLAERYDKLGMPQFSPDSTTVAYWAERGQERTANVLGLGAGLPQARGIGHFFLRAVESRASRRRCRTRTQQTRQEHGENLSHGIPCHFHFLIPEWPGL
jgi:hypothetical protein